LAKRNRRGGLSAPRPWVLNSRAAPFRHRKTEDPVIMAIEHAYLPITAVQFHPESVMTSQSGVGMPIIASVLSALEFESL
jgi:anthranilate/para-aminobenzoate synthase component II